MNNERVPYTYLVRHKPTGKVYYGCRFARGCRPDDLWKTYFTSSKHVKKLIEVDGKDSFEVEIRKVFSDIDSCRIWESKVLTRMKVIRRVDFLNRTNNRSVHPEDAKKGPLAQTGIPKNHSPEGINRIRKANSIPYKDRDWDDAKRERNKTLPNHARGYKRPPETEETRAKKSNSHKGKPSGMLGKQQSVCSCLICHEKVGASGIKMHHKYKHSSN